MNVRVWEQKGYDLIAINGEVNNLIAFKESSLINFIQRETVKIGKYTFTPGQSYTEFGNSKKTGAGYYYYYGEPLKFFGYYDGYLLFLRNNYPESYNEYSAIFFAWKVIKEIQCLFVLNHAIAGRIIEMD